MKVGDLLREWRAKAGLTQSQAGEAAGVSQASIAAYEANKTPPGLERLERLARAYGAEAEFSRLLQSERDRIDARMRALKKNAEGGA